MHFTSDWFSNNLPIWEKHLKTLKDKPLKMLEIGTFEGRSAIWLLENVLTHRDSKIYCVDHWKNNETAYKTFLNNTKKYKDKVTVLKGYSKDMLRNLKHVQFDFIYIDASKHSQNVLEDAVLSFDLLKPDGLMIFDDYTHNKEHDVNCPRPAIDAFMNVYATQIKVLLTRWQVVLKKRKTPLPKKPCYSEFYKEPERTPKIYRNVK